MGNENTPNSDGTSVPDRTPEVDRPGPKPKIAKPQSTGAQSTDPQSTDPQSTDPQSTDPQNTENSSADRTLSELVDYLKLFADESRLRILYYLSSHREVNVRTLCSNLEQTQPAVSHHLGLLRTAGLVVMRREGKHNYYKVAQEKVSRINTLLSGLFPNFSHDDLEQSGKTG